MRRLPLQYLSFFLRRLSEEPIKQPFIRQGFKGLKNKVREDCNRLYWFYFCICYVLPARHHICRAASLFYLQNCYLRTARLKQAHIYIQRAANNALSSDFMCLICMRQTSPGQEVSCQDEWGTKWTVMEYAISLSDTSKASPGCNLWGELFTEMLQWWKPYFIVLCGQLSAQKTGKQRWYTSLGELWRGSCWH